MVVVAVIEDVKAAERVAAYSNVRSGSIVSSNNGCNISGLLHYKHKQKLECTSTYVDHGLLFGRLQIFLWIHFCFYERQEKRR